MSDRGLKVTDKRMFTPDGELREEFVRRQESLGEESARAKDSPVPSTAAVEPEPPQFEAAQASPPPQAPPPQASPPQASPPQASPPVDGPPPEDDGSGGPGFTDLVRLLAENASVYLAESQNGDPQTARQHFELARLHIDMLGILQDKTRGNLTTDEHAMLESVVYQLRSGFVGLGG